MSIQEIDTKLQELRMRWVKEPENRPAIQRDATDLKVKRAIQRALDIALAKKYVNEVSK